MNLVVRANYSQETLVLLAYLSESPDFHEFENRYAVYIDTGWAGEGWQMHVMRGEQFAVTCGFKPIRLTSPASFQDLVQDRGDFPSKKFQWCAGMLKGIPLINWLDERDLTGSWIIAIPRRQALARIPIPETILECPYHGDRKVIHPILKLSDEEKEIWVTRYGLQSALARSLECEPCINLTCSQIAELKCSDIEKTHKLETFLEKNIFLADIKTQVQKARQVMQEKRWPRDSFNRGCGDSFGCGI